MKSDDKLARDLAKIEKAQQRTQERLAIQQARINKRFERMRERLAEKYGGPSDRQQRIIEAALELLKEDGLNNLSLRKLAYMVNMQASGLYWYFEGKEALIDFMAEAILQKEFKDLQPRQENETWQQWLTDHIQQLRKAMLAYPDGGRVVAGAHLYPTVTLGKSFEIALISLHSAGLDLQTARHIIMTATNYTFGYVIEEQAAPTGEQRKHVDWDMLNSLYPTLMKAIDEAPRDIHTNQDEDFAIGLQYIIKGAG